MWTAENTYQTYLHKPQGISGGGRGGGGGEHSLHPSP